jgi:hypothetical protein
MFRLKLGGFLCLAALVVILAGCAEPEPADRLARVPATATVTYNGSPVDGATVTFYPAGESGKGAFGRTDSSGKAILGTYESQDGAVPGEYTVTVFKTEGATSGVVGDAEESDVPDDEGEGAEEAEGSEAGGTLPAKYADMTTSDLNATVTEGGENNFTFALTDE